MGNFCGCNEKDGGAMEHGDAPINKTQLASERELLSTLGKIQPGALEVINSMTEDEKKAAIKALANFEANYPGGVKSYITKAKKLLADSKAKVNPYEGFTVEIPSEQACVRFPEHGDEYGQYETAGLAQLKHTGFVLVAGGLGERLGYMGIKVALTIEKTTGMCYLEYYIKTILGFQARARAESKDESVVLPLAIMTSADTDALTRQLLEENNNFGMAEGQITLLKQPKVPALTSNDADIGFKNGVVLMKPHGHGDVHLLMHRSGTAGRWVEQGVRWITFFQDTNGLVFRSVLAAVGVSSERKLAMNFVTVPRKPGEAIGAICKLAKEAKQGDKQMTINVEYNQMESLLQEGEPTVQNAEGKDTGISVFPGNINVFVIDAAVYQDELSTSKGLVTEFINPKYVPDSNRTKFKKPTRVECMMQDFAKLLPQSYHQGGRVGLSQFPKWRSFSAVKNSLKGGLQRQERGLSTETAISGEMDQYFYTRKVLSDLISFGDADSDAKIAGVIVEYGARVILSPAMCVSLADVRSAFQPESKGDIKITADSSLVLDAATPTATGSQVVIKSLTLDGDLQIRAVPGANVVVQNLTIENEGSAIETFEGSEYEIAHDIWGYVMHKYEATKFAFDAPGDYILSDDTKDQYLV